MESEIPEPQSIEVEDVELVRNIMRPGFPLGIAAGDRESPLAFHVLGDAGIYSERFGPLSGEVIDFIGPQRLGEIKELFGGNWQVAAAFEYCWLNLPHSSPAFVAASYQYHHYITEDDFAAGYHWRDLEIMVHGVEAAALKAIETRKRAGESGSAKSAEARKNRRANLMEQIETLAARNPDLTTLLGPEGVAKLALKECIKEDAVMWKQGRGQVAEYLGEIRRGDAGQDMQQRYKALFGDKPPRRFKGSGKTT